MFTFPIDFTVQAPVAQKLDSAIQRINLYPLDTAIGFPNTYPWDQVITFVKQTRWTCFLRNLIVEDVENRSHRRWRL